MGVLNENVLIGASGLREYVIDNSLRFNDNDSAYLTRSMLAGSSRQQFAVSVWFKPANLGTNRAFVEAYFGGVDFFLFGLDSADRLQIYDIQAGTDYGFTTSARYRDPASAYHALLVVDTTNATAEDRFRLYVNGERVTDKAGDFGNPPLNHTTDFLNPGFTHSIGRRIDTGTYFDGLLSEIVLVDDSVPVVENFGEFDEVYTSWWKPKLPDVPAWGTNGFWLDFEDSGNLGADVSGNGNNWTPVNLAATDQMIDTPTNNFATLNPLQKSSGETTSQGNLETTSSSSYTQIWGNFPVSSGKWYFEGIIYSYLNNFFPKIGVVRSEGPFGYPNADAQGYLFIDRIPANTVGGVAFDADTGEVWVRTDATTWTPSLSSPGFAIPDWSAGDLLVAFQEGYTPSRVGLNFGQDSSFAGNKTAQGNTDSNGNGDFFYPVPAGFLALCADNLPDVDLVPEENFNTNLYTGNGGPNSIAGVNFQPDATWLKNRSSASSHNMFDVIRGAGQRLIPNLANAEATVTDFVSFDSDGFSLDFAQNDTNAVGNNYASWNWKMGGSPVSNTDGSLTSQVSVNTEAGQSVWTWTGSGAATETVGHGMSQAPDVYIVKNITNASDWIVYTSDILNPIHQFMVLNGTNAASSASQAQPTSTVIEVSNLFDNINGNEYVAYGFHNVPNFSKMGVYTGNGSTDGPFIALDFLARWLLVKRADAADDWYILDTERNTYNVLDDYLRPNSNAAEGSATLLDAVSNGIKIRNLFNTFNANGGSYLYMAFAENPFKHTNAR